MKKAFKTHRGVRIYKLKEVIAGSDLKENKNGSFREVAPKYDIFFAFEGSYKYDTPEQAVAEIDRLWKECMEKNIWEDTPQDRRNFAKAMNEI